MYFIVDGNLCNLCNCYVGISGVEVVDEFCRYFFRLLDKFENKEVLIF